MINRICEKALMYAFQSQKRRIDDYMIKFVVEHEMPGTIDNVKLIAAWILAAALQGLMTGS